MPPSRMRTDLAISPLQTVEDAHACARLMAASEPWITLGRSYETSFGIIQDPSREVYVARDESRLAGFLILCMTGALVGYIQTICIDPARRGQGLGSKLVEFAEQRILQGCSAAVRATGLPGRRGAHRLHRSRTLGVSAAQDGGATDRVRLKGASRKHPARQWLIGAGWH